MSTKVLTCSKNPQVANYVVRANVSDCPWQATEPFVFEAVCNSYLPVYHSSKRICVKGGVIKKLQFSKGRCCQGYLISAFYNLLS